MDNNEVSGLIERVVQNADYLGNKKVRHAAETLLRKAKRLEWHLLVLGETSSGKSALVNSLLQTPILPERSIPSTAVVSFIQTAESSIELAGIRHDGTIEKLDDAEFKEACLGKSGFVATKATVAGQCELPAGVVVVDSPGYNSCVTEHTEVLLEYLPFSDAIVLLVSYRRGITQADIQFLEIVRRSTPTGGSLPIVAAINFCPADQGDARTKQMTNDLRRVLGNDLEVVLIPQAKGTPKRIDSKALWIVLRQE